MSKLAMLNAIEPWQWPEDAAATLREVLVDREGSEDDLFLAADLAGDLAEPDEKVALALLAVAEDERCSERSRCAAATSLGPVLDDAEMEGYDEPLSDPGVSEATFRRICDGLHALYRDAAAPKTLRRRALEASCVAARDWHEAAVRAAYASGDPEWRLTAVFCMRSIPNFSSEILAALSDEDEATRRHAILAAGVWEIAEAWPSVAALLKAARDTPRTLLFAAIEAAPTIDPSSAMDLLEKLTLDKDEEIADAADEAVSMCANLLNFGDEFDDDENF